MMIANFDIMKRFSTTLMALAALTLGVAAHAQENTAAITNAAPGTTNAAPAKNIRLQFEGIPYADVIERFSQMAGKPLVSDTNVVGSLTFNDPKPYTYQEALDTLNLMLAMKGVTLIEAGNYLRLVPFKQLPSMPLRILRGSETTGDVRPSEIVGRHPRRPGREDERARRDDVRLPPAGRARAAAAEPGDHVGALERDAVGAVDRGRHDEHRVRHPLRARHGRRRGRTRLRPRPHSHEEVALNGSTSRPRDPLGRPGAAIGSARAGDEVRRGH